MASNTWRAAAVTAAFSLAGGLLLAGCNGDRSGPVPEVASQAKAQAASPDQQAAIVGAEGSGAVASAPASPESVDDAAVSSKVEAALKSEPELHGAAIAVRTEAGVVTLSGTTNDPQRRSMAAQVALSIEGVKLVKNEITLGQEA